MAQKIRDVMTVDVSVCPHDAALAEVAKKMRDEDIGGVVVQRDGELCGFVTDRDIVVRGLADGRGDETEIGEICSTELTTVEPDDDVDAAVRLMREKAVRRLPVVEDGSAVGIVSIGDLAIDRDETSALADISAAPANT